MQQPAQGSAGLIRRWTMWRSRPREHTDMARRVNHVLSLTFIMALVFSTVGSAVAAPNADGPNLLENPGFESPYVKQCCQTDLDHYLPNTPIGEVQVAQGWFGWWLQPDQDPQHPSAGATVD